MTKLTTFSDMGSIKIYNDSMSCFFANDFGDGENIVTIIDKKAKPKSGDSGEFLGHFTVKTEAFLSRYDCADEPIHKFTPGRYFVHLKPGCKFLIQYTDEDIHA